MIYLGGLRLIWSDLLDFIAFNKLFLTENLNLIQKPYNFFYEPYNSYSNKD